MSTLVQENPNAKVSFMLLDLGSFSSIRKFASDYLDSGKPLHLLINNAGVMACPKTMTAEGLEMQFGTNHIGHFLLTTLLLNLIKSSGTETDPARIVSLSSIGQFFFAPTMGIRLDDLNAEKSYDTWERYGSSKLATILFTKQLQKMFAEENAPVVAVTVHPGVINGTHLIRHVDVVSTISVMSKVIPLGLKAFYSFVAGDSKSIGQGAATSVYCALAPDVLLHPGSHFADCHEETEALHPTASDAQLAQDLWTASEAIVNK